MAKSAYLSATAGGGLHWGQELTQGILLRRYKRFLADVELDNGTKLTAHTPNTGAMTGCSEPGRPVWLSRHDGITRKYPYTLEMISMPSGMVGVNTAVPNRLVRAAAEAGVVDGFPFPAEIRSEVRYGGSRLDLWMRGGDFTEVFVEVKNCTLVENSVALFPDAVTERGRKHLGELAALVSEGKRGVLFVLVQRGDGEVFSPADHIDPEWGKELRRVVGLGVEVMAYRATPNTRGVRLEKKLKIAL